jgi:hypothetical protein
MHVAKLMGAFLQILFTNAQKIMEEKKQNGYKVRRKQVWNQLKTETAGNIFLNNDWSFCFVFKEQVTIILLAVTEYQTVCGVLCHADQIVDRIEVWTQLPSDCALSV